LDLSPEDTIVILTGAGISKESGLDTFRDADGIWAKYDLQDVATPEGFRRDPALVLDFYNDRRRQLADPSVQPNAAHRALARLERDWPGEVLLVTQNIDDLHDRGGSRNLIHMHGELKKARCLDSGQVLDWPGDITPETPSPVSGRPGALRPHVVWFGEMPLEMERIFDTLSACRLFLSIGTSGNVYPAAGFVQQAANVGAWTVELNLEATAGRGLFDEAIQGPATEIVPAFVERVLAGRTAG
jgi:NAD-dependent deacetylase